MSFYTQTLPQLKKTLVNLGAWLDKAEAYATEKKFDVNVLCAARLAPDQFAFARQVQAACDSAKNLTARLAGQTPPSHPDTETTFPELRQRLATVAAFLDSFSEKDFEGADERPIRLNFLPPGRGFKGSDYLREMEYPNFHFHVVTAYAILRHNGVPLGKRDYIGGVNLIDV